MNNHFSGNLCILFFLITKNYIFAYLISESNKKAWNNLVDLIKWWLPFLSFSFPPVYWVKRFIEKNNLIHCSSYVLLSSKIHPHLELKRQFTFVSHIFLGWHSCVACCWSQAFPGATVILGGSCGGGQDDSLIWLAVQGSYYLVAQLGLRLECLYVTSSLILSFSKYASLILSVSIKRLKQKCKTSMWKSHQITFAAFHW